MFITRKLIKWATAALMLYITSLAIAKLIEIQEQYTCDNGGLAVIAREGDTYWKIAERHCTGDIRHAVDDMMGNRGADLMPGAIIHLPE